MNEIHLNSYRASIDFYFLDTLYRWIDSKMSKYTYTGCSKV